MFFISPLNDKNIAFNRVTANTEMIQLSLEDLLQWRSLFL